MSRSGTAFDLSEERFGDALRRAIGARHPGGARHLEDFECLGGDVVARLHVHLRCLARWHDLTSLVGPGALGELIERHYAECLDGMRSCGTPRCALDLGSGGGFPGLVLAAAMPGLEVHLVESRQRKAAFLRQAAHAMELPHVRVHCQRIEEFGARSQQRRASLPAAQSVDCVTLRALRLTPRMLRALQPLLAPSVRFVRWGSAEGVDPELPLQAEPTTTPQRNERRDPTCFRLLHSP